MLIIVAWLSLVERCVRDAEVASSNLVATTKNTPSHMCEGVFLFLQLFKLTTSNWFGHTVRAQRVHEVRGTSAWTDRSGAETPRGPRDLGLDRPKRSGDRKFESCLSQCIELTSSNWFGHTVRARRPHEVRGTSAWTDRSGDHKFNFRWFNHGLNAANSLQSP